MYADFCDIYITTPPKGLCVRASKIFAILPHARILVTENRGRDVRPFLELLNSLQDLGINYDSICKIHGKISHHRQDGIDWFNDVIDKLLPSTIKKQESLLRFLHSQASEQFGMIVPSGHVVSFEEYLGGNQFWTGRLQNYFAYGKPCEPPSSFVAGTMFWASNTLCRALVNHFTLDLFEEECGQLDETLAHGYERIFLWCAKYLELNSFNSDFKAIDYTKTGEVRYRYC